MIVVEGAEEMLGNTVEAQAHTTFRSSGGTMVFARLCKDINEDGMDDT
jgi:uncharacterized protein YacL